MSRFPSPFGGDDDEDDGFDAHGAFVPEHLPEPGPFLADHDVLAGTDHAAFHRLTRALFERRGVYDVTFDYNLAQLNLDTRHPDAGFRYAREAGDPTVLRAEFAPTTPFCPQSRALATGAFRAWNGLADRHEYDLVRVRVAPTHQRSDAINADLADLELQFRETGEIADVGDEPGTGTRGERAGGADGGAGPEPEGRGEADAGDTRSPF
jgi:hypothetical protein